MKRLNKSEFMNVAKRKVRDVEVPEWDAIITIKSLSAKVVLECQEYLKKGDQSSFAFALFANSVIDENGNPMFTIEEAEELDYTVLDRLVLEIMDLNNIAPDMVKKARESLKNLRNSSTTSSQ